LRSRSNCITRAGKPERLRHKEEFLAAVAEELDDIGPIDFHPGSTLSGVYVTPESQVRIGLSAGGNRIRTIGPSLEQIVCLASRTVAIGEIIREPDGRKAFAKYC
jgi:hypothetical protein